MQLNNDNTPPLSADENEDPRQRFEEQALAAFYASGSDLASVGYRLYDLAVTLISIYQKPADPPLQPSIDPFA